MTVPPTTAAVILEDVEFRYHRRVILQALTLSVEEGRFVALVGPNGAGKTTMLRLILGLLKPQQGSIHVFGENAWGHRQPIGYVPQRINIPWGFPISAREVVVMGAFPRLGPGRRPGPAEWDEVDHFLDQVGLGNAGERRFTDMSGGQQQRVLIARALVAHPRILVLDEPTAGLDPAARSRFYGLVCDLQRSRGLTVLCASHDIDDVSQHADELLVLDRTLKASGSPSEVMASPALEDAYHFPPPHVHQSPEGTSE
jgi:ABC-type Mn2+/Zn2+ transport system ATPase subunit